MKSKLFASLLALAAVAGLMTGCKTVEDWWTSSGKSATIAPVEKDIGAVVTDYMATGKVSQAQVIGLVLQSICDEAASVQSVPALSQLISTTVQQFTADYSATGKITSQQVAAAVVADIPLIGATAAQITNALISNGTKATNAANGTAITPTTTSGSGSQ